MPSPRTSAENLARWRQRAGMRSANESLAIKKCIWQWRLLSPEHRKPATQCELAKALGVSRAYVSKLIKGLWFDTPFDLLAASPITPAHVIAMRQRQEQFDRQRDQEARDTAEAWTEAGRQEEARAQCEGRWPEQGLRKEGRAQREDRRADQTIRNANQPEDTEDAEWEKFQEDVRRVNRFPWDSKYRQR